MIYELHGKIPQNSSFIYSEDVLTSTIFGNLRYLKSPLLLNDFLSKAKNSASDNFSFEFSGNLKISFWKKFTQKSTFQINEPDLVLEDENQVLIIECKYHSPLDENYSPDYNQYMNQLLRYSSILDEYYPNKKNRNIIFLTLKDYDVEELFEKTEKKLSKDIGLFWLRWEELFSCLNKYLENVSDDGEKTLIMDLKDFLIKRQLKFFSGITIPRDSYSWKYKKNKKYSFSSKFESYAWRYNHE